MSARRSRFAPHTTEPCVRCRGQAICECYEGRQTAQQKAARDAARAALLRRNGNDR